MPDRPIPSPMAQLKCDPWLSWLADLLIWSDSIRLLVVLYCPSMSVQIINENCYIYDFHSVSCMASLGAGRAVECLLNLKENNVIDAFNLDDSEHYLMVRMEQNGPY
jgi:hypothetical protein